jgi:hypothetical protein
MPQCVSNKANGQRCTKNGDPTHDGMCGTHHNQRVRNDLAYAVRFQVVDAPPAHPPALQRMDAVAFPLMQRPRVVAVRLPAAGQPRPPVNEALRRYNRLRTEIINARDDLQQFMNLGRDDFGNNALFDQIEPTFHQLAAVFERIQPLREHINEQVEVQANNNLMTINLFVRRVRTAAQPVMRRRRENAIHDMVNAIFINAGDENQVVFQRDPEGGVNLRAFALDNQSVHRSSVQEMAQKGIEKILVGPAPAPGTDTLFEITVAFTDPSIPWAAGTYEQTIQELHRDYEIVEAFGINYSQAINHLWAFVKTHVERIELTRRLAEELLEGRGMCSNGKMARLVNVVQGYDSEMVVVLAPLREQFQSKIAALASHPVAERREAAMVLFAEYKIPAAEHDAWLEPLLEA